MNNINIGLGFMRHNIQMIEQNQKLIDHAMNNNINYFETALGYLNFQCESYVYSLLEKYNREQYMLCGKMPIQSFCDRTDFKEAYYKQLKLVPQNYFDVYLLQAINPIANYIIIEQEILPFFLEEKKKGNIQQLGFSADCDSLTLSNLLPLIKWDIAQMPLNYFNWYLCGAKENYDLITSYNIPIIAQAPLKGGFLINELNQEELKLLNYQPFEAALFFLKQLPNIKYVLAGCTKYEHLNNYINYKDNICFDENVYKQVIKSYQSRASIFCYGCNKCFLACPKHVPIASFFKIYNKSLCSYTNFLDIMELKYYYGEPVEHCFNCNKECEKVCPNDNQIRELLLKNIFYLRT